jgi:hypothetical protein
VQFFADQEVFSSSAVPASGFCYENAGEKREKSAANLCIVVKDVDVRRYQKCISSGIFEATSGKNSNFRVPWQGQHNEF